MERPVAAEAYEQLGSLDKPLRVGYLFTLQYSQELHWSVIQWPSVRVLLTEPSCKPRSGGGSDGGRQLSLRSM